MRDRRCRTSYTSSQLQTLMNAFMENPYPGIDSREQLAEDIGVPESRVQASDKEFDIGRNIYNETSRNDFSNRD